MEGITKKDKSKYRMMPAYTVVHHKARQHLRLTVADYMIIDTIHRLSHTDPRYIYCVLSKNDLAAFLGVNERTVFRAIKGALERSAPLLEKNERGDLRTTQYWLETVELFKPKKD